jgi:hypothetical protein
MPELSKKSARETRPGIPFMVFELIEGDDCLVTQRDTFAEAQIALLEHAETLTAPDASLSICHGLDGILALWDTTHGYVVVPKRP